MANIIYSFIAGIDFMRQILTYKVDPRAERVMSSPTFYEP